MENTDKISFNWKLNQILYWEWRKWILCIFCVCARAPLFKPLFSHQKLFWWLSITIILIINKNYEYCKFVNLCTKLYMYMISEYSLTEIIISLIIMGYIPKDVMSIVIREINYLKYTLFYFLSYVVSLR